VRGIHNKRSKSVFLLFSIILLGFNPSIPGNQTLITNILNNEFEAQSVIALNTNDSYVIATTTMNFKCNLTKVESNGTILWSRTYNGSTYESATSLLQCSDQGFLLAGYTSKNGYNRNIHIIKTDSNGNEEWRKKYQSSGDEETCSIIPIEEGFAIAGNVLKNQTTNYDFLLLRIDFQGNELWRRTYGSTQDERVVSIIRTSDGGFILCGEKDPSLFDANIWLVKTNQNGTMEWNITIGGPGNDISCGLIQTTNQDYVIGGYTTSYGSGNADIWLIKTNSTGSLLWNRTYGGPNEERTNSFIQTNDHGFAITGCSEHLTYNQVLVLKIDSDGFLQWKQEFPFYQQDAKPFTILTQDNSYIVSGLKYKSGVSPNVFLLRINPPSNFTWFPVANAGEDVISSTHHPIAFHGSGFTPNSSIIQYQWDFDGDGIFDWVSSRIGSINYTYNTSGAYHALLQVQNTNGNTTTDSRIITILNNETISSFITPTTIFVLVTFLFFCLILTVCIFYRRNQTIISFCKKWTHSQPTIWWYRLGLMIITLTACKVLFSIMISTPIINYDEFAYGVTAHEISQGKFIILGTTFFTHDYPAGYSYLLAPAYYLSNDMNVVYHTMLLINSILTSLILIPVFFIMRRYVTEKTAFLTAILIGCLPVILSYNYLLMSENAFITVFIFSCWLVLKTFTSPTHDRYFFFTSILLGCCILFLLLLHITAIAMIGAILLLWGFKIIQQRRLETLKYATIFIPFLFLIGFFLKQSTLNTMGYRLQDYINTITTMFSTPVHFIKFLRLFLNELDYFILMGYIITIGFSIYLILERKNYFSEKKQSLQILGIYGITTGLILAFITVVHIYSSPFLIYSRYEAASLPIFIMIGIVGMNTYFDQRKKTTTLKIHLTIIFIFLFSLIILTFPIGDYKIINNLDLVWIENIHLTIIKNIPLFVIFLTICLLVTSFDIVIFFRLWKKKIKLKKININKVLYAVILISLLLFVPTLQYIFSDNEIIRQEIRLSEPAQWFIENEPNTTILLQDHTTTIFSSAMSRQYWLAMYAHLNFWLPQAHIQIMNRSAISLIIPEEQKNSTYLLSTYYITEFHPLKERISMDIPMSTSVVWYIYKIK
jgi:PKD repeat protein